MKHLERLLTDMILEVIEAYIRLRNIFRDKPKPSLLVTNVLWCTNSQWMDRLVAYRQLKLWTDR